MLDKISEAVEHLHPDSLEDLSPTVPDPEKDDVSTDQCRPLKGEFSYHEKSGDFLSGKRVSVRIVITAWFPGSTQTATSLLQYNLAVAFAIRGELDKAGETLKQVRHTTFRSRQWDSRNLVTVRVCRSVYHLVRVIIKR